MLKNIDVFQIFYHLIKNKSKLHKHIILCKKIILSIPLKHVLYIPEIKVLELIKYNKRLKQILKIDKYKYQKLFIENYFMVDLSKFKISNLIKYFKTNYNNFSGKGDENNLKKILSEIPWFNDYKKEKLVTKNEDNYKKCLKKEELKKLMESNNTQLLSNLKILNITNIL